MNDKNGNVIIIAARDEIERRGNRVHIGGEAYGYIGFEPLAFINISYSGALVEHDISQIGSIRLGRQYPISWKVGNESEGQIEELTVIGRAIRSSVISIKTSKGQYFAYQTAFEFIKLSDTKKKAIKDYVKSLEEGRVAVVPRAPE